MADTDIKYVTGLLQREEAAVLQGWLDRQLNTPGFRPDRIHERELHEQSRRFLDRTGPLFRPARLHYAAADAHGTTDTVRRAGCERRYVDAAGARLGRDRRPRRDRRRRGGSP